LQQAQEYIYIFEENYIDFHSHNIQAQRQYNLQFKKHKEDQPNLGCQ